MSDRVDLLDDLERAAGDDVVRLPGSLADWWITSFRDLYVAANGGRWWWRTLRVPAARIHYGDEDGLARVLETVREWGVLVLLVTDEAQTPTGAFLGFAPELVEMARNVRNFEFVVMTTDCERWVFDTHDNAFFVFDGTGRRVDI